MARTHEGFLHGGRGEAQNGGQRFGGGRLLRLDQVLDEVLDGFVLVGDAFVAEEQHVFQGSCEAAGFADVVDDHEAVVRVDDIGEEFFGLDDLFFVESLGAAAEDQLFDQDGKALGEDGVGRLGILVFVIVEEFEGEGKLLEGVALKPRLFGGALALLHLAIEVGEFLLLSVGRLRVLLKQ